MRGTEVRDASDDYALIAVQGPASLDRLGLDDGKAFTHGMGEVGGVEVMVCRTGYTGETGVELLCAAEDGAALWDAVLERGVVPCGLGARDTLRLEVCSPLHGNDITTETDAISAGLRWAWALDTEFTGPVPATITYHVACHLRAQDVGLPGRDLLRLTGARLRLVERCAGMGSLWGMQAANDRPSRQLAAAVGDEVRRVDADVVAGDCQWANTVIAEQTAAEVRHPLQILARAYGIPPEP